MGVENFLNAMKCLIVGDEDEELIAWREDIYEDAIDEKCPEF